MKLSTVNRSLKRYGYELVKGEGYFYYMPLNSSYPLFRDSMVMTTTLGRELNFWIEELENKIKNNY